jgi:hypothetical protein
VLAISPDSPCGILYSCHLFQAGSASSPLKYEGCTDYRTTFMITNCLIWLMHLYLVAKYLPGGQVQTMVQR